MISGWKLPQQQREQKQKTHKKIKHKHWLTEPHAATASAAAVETSPPLTELNASNSLDASKHIGTTSIGTVNTHTERAREEEKTGDTQNDFYCEWKTRWKSSRIKARKKIVSHSYSFLFDFFLRCRSVLFISFHFCPKCIYYATTFLFNG